MRGQRKNIFFQKKESRDKNRSSPIWSQASRSFNKFIPRINQSYDDNKKQIILQSVKNARNMNDESESFLNFINGQKEKEKKYIQIRVCSPKANIFQSNRERDSILEFKVKKSTKTILSQIQHVSQAKQVFQSFKSLAMDIKNMIMKLEVFVEGFPSFKAFTDKLSLQTELKLMKQAFQEKYNMLCDGKGIEMGFIKMIQKFMRESQWDLPENKQFVNHQFSEQQKKKNDLIKIKENSRKFCDNQFQLKFNHKFEGRFMQQIPISLKQIQKFHFARYNTCESTERPSQIQSDQRFLTPQYRPIYSRETDRQFI